MKKKHVLFIFCFALVLSSCLFENDDNGLSSWLSYQGLPDNYKVQTLSISDLVPDKVNAYWDSTPKIASSRIVFGTSSNISHEMMLDFNYISNSKKIDSAYIKKFTNSDDIKAYVRFYGEKEFYKDKKIKNKNHSIKENLKLNISWKLTKGNGKKFIDSIANIPDSIWVKSLKTWAPDVVFDTVVSVSSKDSITFFDLPEKVVGSMIDCNLGCRLEMRIAAPETENLYRYYAASAKEGVVPVLAMRSIVDSDTMKIFVPPYRMADVTINNDCKDCLVLHGGISDSLVAEFSADPILNALSDFYGDEFPYKVGDGYDVRQTVVLAQLTFARDDSFGENHLGLPIKVYVASYIDSSGKDVLYMEPYKWNSDLVKENGHPNIVFYKGDSLTLQVTIGLRDFINRASKGTKLKMMMRLGLPQLQDKSYRDTIYTWKVACDTIDNKAVCDTLSGDSKTQRKNVKTYTDTSDVFLSHLDYARYDFAYMMSKPATLKLWLATKRGDK